MQKAQAWVKDTSNQKKVAGGVFSLLALKLITGREKAVDENFSTIQITVPPHAQAGTTMEVSNPHMPQQVFTVKVPDGKKSGSNFSCKVPKCPKDITIQIPEGKVSGDTIPVEHPGRPTESFLVKVPMNKKAGSSFKVKLP